MKKILAIFLFVPAAFSANSLHAQTAQEIALQNQPSNDAKAKSDIEQEKKAAEWTSSLNLNDAAKEAKVKAAITIHLKRVRDWH